MPDRPGDHPGGPPDPPAALELVPAGPVDLRLAVPASKSVTNRALLCAALAEGTSRLRGAAGSDDAEAMAPDAILISPLDSNAVVPQLTRAMEGGTEVYAFNTAAPNATLTATVAMDEVATGAVGAHVDRSDAMYPA